jgi:predicted amidophosphoribosyltransferase
VISLSALSEIIFPSRCLGCRRLGIRICSLCRSSWNPHIYRSQITSEVNTFPVYSAVEYSTVAQRVLLGSKESGLRDADQLIIQALMHSLSYINSEQGIADLVPVPSRKSVTRRRGRNFLLVQTIELSKSPRVLTRPALGHTRRVKDQSSLNAKERQVNLSGSLACIQIAERVNIPVIIVDDVVTTGATLREAGRALSAGGFTVIGAITACVAKPLRYTQ